MIELICGDCGKPYHGDSDCGLTPEQQAAYEAEVAAALDAALLGELEALVEGTGPVPPEPEPDPLMRRNAQ
jgi:hypothetical protein